MCQAVSRRAARARLETVPAPRYLARQPGIEEEIDVTRPIAVGGMLLITLFKIAFSPFAEGPGIAGWIAHLGHEWVLITNLFGLLLGFALLSKHVEAVASRNGCPNCCRTTGKSAWSCFS